MYNPDYNGIIARQGWECPRCGRINSPSMPWCICSDEKEVTVTTTGTGMSSSEVYRCTEYGPSGISTTTIDIVKCKDCKRKYLKGLEMYCPERVHTVSLDGYCENGERK